MSSTSCSPQFLRYPMPQIEEVLDDEIDQQHLSLEEFDPHNPFSRDMPVEEGAPVQLRPTTASQDQPRPPTANTNTSTSSTPQNFGPGEGSFNQLPPGVSGVDSPPEFMKSWTIMYPIYFDQAKTRSQGRRVDYSVGCSNPLVLNLSTACSQAGYKVGVELSKRHPKDWSNPGRVRVDLGKENKTTAMKKIAKFLKAIPVDKSHEEFYRRLGPFDSLTPIASLRNDKLHKILPGNSAALDQSKTLKQGMEGLGDMGKMFGM